MAMLRGQQGVGAPKRFKRVRKVLAPMWKRIKPVLVWLRKRLEPLPTLLIAAVSMVGGILVGMLWVKRLDPNWVEALGGWVGGLGTVAAVLLALHQLRKDQRTRDLERARQDRNARIEWERTFKGPIQIARSELMDAMGVEFVAVPFTSEDPSEIARIFDNRESVFLVRNSSPTDITDLQVWVDEVKIDLADHLGAHSESRPLVTKRRLAPATRRMPIIPDPLREIVLAPDDWVQAHPDLSTLYARPSHAARIIYTQNGSRWSRYADSIPYREALGTELPPGL